MAHARSLIRLIAGASLLGLVTRVAIPPLAWLSLTLLVHASRSMPVASGARYVWLALYLALLVGQREIVLAPGLAYPW